ncbi:MAG TPA: coenzyme F420-0:L-glutamate ligase [Chloroflexia bacterium]|nr:coenzyme F420-0:L-glutamate ligase [Chloroflexia bacterium]
MQITIIGITTIPEVKPGDDLADLILDGCAQMGAHPQDGDVLVVTQKIVSKAEGCLVDLREVEPSAFARQYAEAWGKDARHVEVVLRESKRIVRMDRGLIISETQHGFVCANAGVDASNVPGEHVVGLLPKDPDASAKRIREAIKERLDVDVPVIISDSFGRAWRNGIINVAVGVSGLQPLIDYRGQRDSDGYLLSATIIAVADELASAAELVMGKLDACPAAIVRGYPYERAEGAARELIMDPTRDMFR